MEPKNLLVATVVGASATTTATTKIAAAIHWDNASDITNFQIARFFGVGAERDNTPTGFMADCTRTFNPGEIWLAATGAVIRSANANK